MSGRSKTANLLKPKIGQQPQSAKKPSTANSLYSGVLSAQRTLQQQQQQRYLGSPSIWRSAQSKRGGERTPVVIIEKCDNPVNYHSWESEYSQIITRDKRVKSMTKDPYTPMSRLISHAVENVTNEKDSYPKLISAKAVKIQTVNIRQAPRASMPSTTRYVRRDELMPSEQSVRTSTPVKIPVLSELENKKPIISVMNINKITAVAPTLVTTNRLLNRAKIRIDSSAIRRPPRKLKINVNYETIMPLSVCG